MFTLRIGKKEYAVKEEVVFEAYYFYLLRNRVDARGMKNSKILFEIVESKELSEDRRRMVVSDPGMWIEPTRQQLLGLLEQFANLTELARRMGISRLTIGKWKRKGTVSFLAWHFMCEVLGIGDVPANKVRLRDIQLPRERKAKK